MFVLRRITKVGNEMNTCLGDNYHIVLKEINGDEYKKSLSALKWEDEEILYGFVIYTFQEKLIHYPLYKFSSYFVMMSDGKTFANITFK